MQNKTVLITGGAGFIGANIAAELYKKNKVIIIDDFSTAGKLSKQFIEGLGITLIEGSITNEKAVKMAFSESIDYVFHQAAIPSVGRSVKNPVATHNVNVSGTLMLLKTAAECNIKKFVYASSSSVYGDTVKLPKIESMELNPKSPYAVSKLAAEHYCRVFNEIYGLKTISLRYFNVYGQLQNPYSEYSAVIPKFMYSALQNKNILIFGDGKQTRDFSYIHDVVNANIKAAESKAVGIFNIGGGNRISINELASIIIKITNSKSKVVHIKPRVGDIKHSLASITKAEELLSWKPMYNIKEGLNEYYKWIMSY